MRNQEGRLSGDCVEDATARIWDKYPEALAVVIRYLYCGWWEFEVIERPSCTAMQRGPEVEHFTKRHLEDFMARNEVKAG